jgi:hypothetical protein
MSFNSCVLTLRVRLWLLILLVAAPGVGVQVYAHSELRREREADAVDGALALAKQVTSETDRIVEGARGILIALSEVPVVKRLEAEPCSFYLADLGRRYEQVNNISIIAADGTPVCAAVPVTRGANISGRFYFKAAMEHGFAIGSYVVGRMVRQPALPFALAVQDQSGAPIAVAALHLDLVWLGEYFKQQAAPFGAGITLADRHGVVLSSTEPGVKLGTTLPPERMALLESGKEGVVEQKDARGQSQIVAFTPIDASPQGIWIMTALPREAVVHSAEEAAARELTAIGAILAVTLLLAGATAEWFIRRRVLKAFEEHAAATAADAPMPPRRHAA